MVRREQSNVIVFRRRGFESKVPLHPFHTHDVFLNELDTSPSAQAMLRELLTRCDLCTEEALASYIPSVPLTISCPEPLDGAITVVCAPTGAGIAAGLESELQGVH